MKNILKFIIAILITNYSYSQNIIPIEERKNTIVDCYNEEYYFKDINGVLNKFLGNWKFEDNTQKVEISFYLRTYERGLNDRFHDDEIYGKIKFTKNNVVIYDTFASNGGTYNNIKGSSFTDTNNLNKLNLYYMEPGLRGDTGRLEIEYQYNSGNPILLWHLKSHRSLTINPFQIPYQLTLNKI